MVKRVRDKQGNVVLIVPGRAGFPQKRFPLVPGGDAEVEAWKYDGELNRALDVIDAEVRALSLSELRNFVLARRLLPPGRTLAEWVEELYGLRSRPAKVGEVWRQFNDRKAKSARSEVYIRQFKSYVGDFVEENRDRQIVEITPTEIRAMLELVESDHTHNKTRAMLSSFFGFALSSGYITRNPVENIPTRDAKARGEIAFLRLGEVEVFLRTAYAVDPGMIYYYALQLFAGFRPNEAKEYPITLGTGYLRIAAKRAKTRSSRAVPISPPLATLFSVLPAQTAEYRVRSDARIRLEVAKQGIDLPPDVLRHTYATYRFPLVDEGELARDMGNSPAMLHRHYRGVATRDEAQAFFACNPIEYISPKPEHGDGVGGVLGEGKPGE